MRFQIHIRRGVLCGLVAALILLSPSAAWAGARASATPETTLVSREGEPPGTTGRGYESSLSADGRFVGFWDGAVALVRDLRARTTVVASRASGAQGAIADASPFPPSLSTDGRFVAFTSPARTLDPDDGDNSPDVFVRDLLEQTTTLVSRASGVSGAKGNRESIDPSISGDGRFVTFASRASNLDPDDAEPTPPDRGVGIEPAWDIFVRDLATGTTVLVSRATGARGSDGNGASLAPSISADGRFVAFQSFATNLHPEDSDPRGDIHVRDLATATTHLRGPRPGSGPPEDGARRGVAVDLIGRPGRRVLKLGRNLPVASAHAEHGASRRRLHRSQGKQLVGVPVPVRQRALRGLLLVRHQPAALPHGALPGHLRP
jgi:WD40-like Beta Propeller Repeat